MPRMSTWIEYNIYKHGKVYKYGNVYKCMHRPAIRLDATRIPVLHLRNFAAFVAAAHAAEGVDRAAVVDHSNSEILRGVPARPDTAQRPEGRNATGENSRYA